MAKKAAATKPMSKAEIVAALAEGSSLSKKVVGDVLDHLEGLVAKSISKKGPGVFALPGLLKIQVVEKKAVPAREGRNPATGEKIQIAAKPARKVVKVRALKKLKEMI